MPTPQQQINYGNTANDGQGDPLRTAFIKTDDNFDAIWNAGPVGSNITVLNNTVQAQDTNGNITLSPNGIGTINVTRPVIPTITNAHDLGSANSRFRAIWVGSGGLNSAGNIAASYFIGDGSLLTGLPEGYGNADVAAYLPTYTGNLSGSRIVIENDPGNAWTIAGNSIYAPSGGEWRSENDSLDDFVTSAANGYINLQSLFADGNIASELKLEHGVARLVVANEPFKEWTFRNTGVLEVPGNITPTANGVYNLGDQNNQWGELWVANNTIYLGGVAIGVTGNVLTVAGEPVLSNDSDSSIVTTGDITANAFIGDGSQLTGLPAGYTDANVAAYLPTYTGNLAGGNLTIQNGAGNTWRISGQRIVAPSGGEWRSENDSLDDFITSANDGYINLQSLYADGNIASELHLEHGVAHIRIADGPFDDWYFLSGGTMTTPGHIIPQANGMYNLGNATNQWANLWVANNTIYLGGVALGISAGNVLTVAGEPVLSNNSGSDITTTGNITAGNLVGNISITGNVQGTSANVDLVAGSYTWTFNNTGNLVLPGNTFAVNYANGTAVTLTDTVNKVSGSWTVTTGTNNYSFTVPENGVYQLWVRGNIPNGIITYTATVSVTNTNVPVIGQQFAWNYEGGGNIILFTSIPDQIIGTAGTISNASPAVGTTTNTFVFGINNSSGGNVTVEYGYTTIS